MSVAIKIIVGSCVLLPMLYGGACSAISHHREHGFAQVKIGDTKQQVIAIMGEPADHETAGGTRLAKYGVAECKAPCSERLWYTNKLSLAGEAWDVELDSSGRVMHAAHIVSP